MNMPIHCDAGYFEALYVTGDDPWHYRTRWYEARKRALTLACLPREHYRSGFEPACGNGELAACLAPRCDALLCFDLNARAVELAAERCARWPHIRVECHSAPDDWPDQFDTAGSGLSSQGSSFDLIVLSELLYYLQPSATAQLVARAEALLADDGTLLACHWAHPFEGATQSAREAHAAFETHTRLTRLVHHEEPDLLLDVWSKNAGTVASIEGIS